MVGSNVLLLSSRSRMHIIEKEIPSILLCRLSGIIMAQMMN